MAETQPADVPQPAAPQPGPEVSPLTELTPYSKDAQKAIKQFFVKRNKNTGYGYDDKGDLKGPDGTLSLLRFVPLDPAYRDAQEQMRLDQIAQIETALVEAGAALREAYATGAVPAILRANQEVTDLEVQRSALRSAVRGFMDIGNLSTRQILLDQPYEVRKLIRPSSESYQYYEKRDDPRVVANPDRLKNAKDPFDNEIVQMIFRNFPSERFYGRYVPDEAAPKEAPAEAPEEIFRQTLKDGRKARIFFDTEDAANGFMSPMWPVEFTLGETRYFTALQAYEAERAKELRDEALRSSLLKTRSARTIRILTQKVTDHPADAKGLWLSIYTAVYQQHPELLARLLETGTDSIVYADARAGPSGVGVSDKDKAVLDPTRWKGENAAGLAQETVRSRARESTLEEAPAGNATEGVVTEEEQAAAKVGAIINARRNGNA
jgi:predicted NAD-dependent protein-ADP-ribosyltransferase YbiA (DUF1768 family)